MVVTLRCRVLSNKRYFSAHPGLRHTYKTNCWQEFRQSSEQWKNAITGNSFFSSKGGQSVQQRGGRAPPFLGKRGLQPIFWGAPAKILIPKILTEFSFVFGMVNTEKYRPIPTEKYRLGIQLYKWLTLIIAVGALWIPQIFIATQEAGVCGRCMPFI
jgi:hypothetical protein